MNRFFWKKADVPDSAGVQCWTFQAAGAAGIYSWIIKRGPLYLRYEPYKRSPHHLNLLTDGCLFGVYTTIEAAQRSIINTSSEILTSAVT